MTALRASLPIITIAAVFALANALAAGDWLTAAPLAVMVCVGLFFLAPGAVASPSPRSAATEAGQQGKAL